MKKKQIDEKQLLADAEAWFEGLHHQSAKDLGWEFIQIWRKPTPFSKTIAVVFAPTREAGKAFIWEQNLIFRAMKNFWLLPTFLILACFAGFYTASRQDGSVWFVLGVAIGILICALFLCEYFYRKCKKTEKIHQWKVDVYYPNL